ncbi:acyltransferase family protein [Proteus vulgaris]|uniref:acyltransferase family protein n=1 Tax=Proteus vulgaris TaxID=585 RepID=UPI0018CEA6BD|nr:acyltransferase family protein [Proteus vulgaris]QPN90688.1 acyltransferase [Proteus vulgaris]
MNVKYRADIDGLRAVAVILVIFFHFDNRLIPSGFIGVDIFFVISGFLISSIIKNALSQGNFSFRDFYIRRLWRLQPLYLFVLLSVLVISSFFYLPSDYLDITNSEKYASALVSNKYFARATTSYAAQDALFLPLLHTWSLAIEWQWYLFLPFALYFLHKINHKEKINNFYPVVFITIISFSLVFFYQKDQPKNYYFFSTRIFEFMLGVCVAYLPTKVKLHQSVSDAISLIALGVIFWIAFQKGVIAGYPNFNTLYVCLGAALIIYTGQHGNIIKKILSLKPIVIVGLLSYSLYLWHWPLFAIARYIGVFNTEIQKGLLLALTLLLSIFSYLLIEKPFRRKRLEFKYSFAFLLIVPILLALGLNALNEKYQGFGVRLGQNYVNLEAKLNQFDYQNRAKCMNFEASDPDKMCHIGDIGSQKKAFLLGDSHANHYWGFMDILGKDAKIDVYTQATSSCITLPNIYLYDWSNHKNTVYQRCYDQTAKYYQLIKNNHFDYVIFGQVWNNYASNHVINKIGDVRTVEESRKRVEKAMREALDIIITTGAKPVFIKTVNSMPSGFMTCFYENAKLRKDFADNNCNPKNYKGEGNTWMDQLFVKLKKDYPALIIIDPKDVQCDKNVCLTDIEGVPVYRDVGHITDYASTLFGMMYLERFGNPLEVKNTQ